MFNLQMAWPGGGAGAAVGELLLSCAQAQVHSNEPGEGGWALMKGAAMETSAMPTRHGLDSVSTGESFFCSYLPGFKKPEH